VQEQQQYWQVPALQVPPVPHPWPHAPQLFCRKHFFESLR